MKRMLLVMLTLTVMTMFALPAIAADHPEAAADHPKPKMHMYHIAMAKPGPNWKSQATEEGMEMRMQVIDGIKKAAKSGLVVSAGLVNDETGVEFIIIIDVETKTEAYQMLMNAPKVKSGYYSVDIYSYFAPFIVPAVK